MESIDSISSEAKKSLNDTVVSYDKEVPSILETASRDIGLLFNSLVEEIKTQIAEPNTNVEQLQKKFTRLFMDLLTLRSQRLTFFCSFVETGKSRSLWPSSCRRWTMLGRLKRLSPRS